MGACQTLYGWSKFCSVRVTMASYKRAISPKLEQNDCPWLTAPHRLPSRFIGAVVPGAPSYLQVQARAHPPPSWGPRPRHETVRLDEVRASPNDIDQCLIASDLHKTLINSASKTRCAPVAPSLTLYCI